MGRNTSQMTAGTYKQSVSIGMKLSYIRKFCKKKISLQATSRKSVTCIQNIPWFSLLIQGKAVASCTLNTKFLELSVQKLTIDSSATDHFFSNPAYFSTYKKYYHKYQTSSRQILAAHRYGRVILHLGHLGGLKMI